jgi:hypothetical protein
MAVEPIATPSAPSPVADFAEAETKLVALPRAGAGGKALAVLIRAVPTIDLVKAMEGVPDLNRSESGSDVQSFEAVRGLLLRNEGPQQRIAELGIVEPKFFFGEPEEGKAPWRNVHGENQAAIVAAIMDLSGFGPAKTGAAVEAETFRGVAGQ